mgnify:CR=1 FL=1
MERSLENHENEIKEKEEEIKRLTADNHLTLSLIDEAVKESNEKLITKHKKELAVLIDANVRLVEKHKRTCKLVAD